jgi:hypothetical protein
MKGPFVIMSVKSVGRADVPCCGTGGVKRSEEERGREGKGREVQSVHKEIESQSRDRLKERDNQV